MAVTNLHEHMPREYADKLQSARVRRSMHGERRVITILFCDVKGSTTMAGKLDPEDWAEMMNEAFEYLISPVYRYEGTVARLMGDAVLAFFGAPIAHEDDPQRAVLAGLDILKGIEPFCDEIKKEYGLDFGVRIGINTGPVVVGEIGSDLAMEYTAMGDAANVAARLEETAAPGTIQISETTYKLVAPLFQIEALGKIEVKGKEEPIQTYRVIDVKAEPERLRGIEGLNAPLIGRPHEMKILTNALDNLLQGRGGIITILGEGGLGKSRLIDEISTKWQEGAEDQATWFSSRGISFDTSQPYGLFQQLLRKMSGIGAHDSPEKAREKIGSYLEQIPTEQLEQTGGVVELLLSIGKDSEVPDLGGEAFQRDLYSNLRNILRFSVQNGPAIYIFDDLHWADSASVELLIHVLQLVDELPILFLCALRPYRQSPGWQVKLHAETNYPHRYQEIVLKPLLEDESQELICQLIQISNLPSDIRNLILQKAEGNPFFVEEVIRSLIDQGIILRDESGIHRHANKNLEGIFIPDNLQALLTARIDRLTSEVRSTLQYAAVIGRTFYQRILKWVSELEGEIDEHLITLQQVDLIRETSRIPEIEYVFRHELTRDAAYRTILRRERKKFHRRVAEALETTFPERMEELAPRLAHHFDQAGEYDKALIYYTKAGDVAAKLYANQEAITHYTRAIELIRQIDIPKETRIHLHTQLGRTFEVVGQYDEALANYKQLEAFGIEHHNYEIELAAIIPQATIHSIPTGKVDFERGTILSERGLELAEELQDPRSKAKVLWNLMLLHYFSPEETLIDYGEEAIKLARVHNPKDELAYILNDQARAYASLNQFDDARRLLQESQELWRELENLPMLADNLSMTAYAYMEAGQFEQAISLAQEAFEISQSIDNLWGQAYSSTIAGPIYLELGMISQGLQTILEGERIAEQANFLGSKILNPSILCWIYASLGDLVQANKMLNRARVDSKEMSLFRKQVETGAAWLKLREGYQTKAIDLLSKALTEESSEIPDAFLGSLIMNFQSEVALANGDLEGALSLVNENIKSMDEGGRNLYRPDVLLLKTKILRQRGREEEGLSVLREAKALAERIGSRRSLLFILGTLLEIVKQKGNTAEMEALQTQGKEIASFISDHISDPDLKRSFNNLSEVRSFYA